MKAPSFLAVSAGLIVAVASQIPLPKRPLGFVFNGGEPTAPILLTAFVDLTCPDSKQAWPTVKKVAEVYGPKVLQFTVHLFPLPYHTNAFMAAQSVYAVDAFNSSLVMSWLTTVFANQEQLYNSQTMGKDRYDVINIISDLGSDIGVDKSIIKHGLTNDEYNGHTRISWKYGCSRTVSGTPFFFLNDIFVREASSSWSVDNWKQLIDPLLNVRLKNGRN